MLPHNSPTTNAIDAGAFTLYMASFANVIPAVAAFLSAVWFILRIMETRTVQHLLGRYAWVKREGDKDEADD